MMMNGAMIITKIKEVVCCLNTYYPYWLETISFAAAVLFN